MEDFNFYEAKEIVEETIEEYEQMLLWYTALIKKIGFITGLALKHKDHKLNNNLRELKELVCFEENDYEEDYNNLDEPMYKNHMND